MRKVAQESLSLSLFAMSSPWLVLKSDTCLSMSGVGELEKGMPHDAKPNNFTLIKYITIGEILSLKVGSLIIHL